MWSRLLCVAALLLAAPAALGQGDACFGPDSQCEACMADGVGCKKCAEGHYLDADRYCMACKDPRAATCTATRTLTCVAAEADPRYLLVHLDRKSGTCKACPGLSSLGACTACGSDGKCSECTEGHYLQRGVCKACSDPLCKRCTAKACLECDALTWTDFDLEASIPEFPVYKDRSGRCQKCTAHPFSSGCTRCGAKGRCKKCNLTSASFGGAVLDRKRGKCVSCKDPLCAKCDPAQPSKCFKCQTVPYTSFLYDVHGPVYGMVYRDTRTGKCRECAQTVDTGCQACNGRGECIRCQKGSGTLLRGRCVPCSAFLDNCATCSPDGKTCSECVTGYGFKGKACVKCPEGCSSCVRAEQGSCSSCSTDGIVGGGGLLHCWQWRVQEGA